MLLKYDVLIGCYFYLSNSKLLYSFVLKNNSIFLGILLCAKTKFAKTRLAAYFADGTSNIVGSRLEKLTCLSNFQWDFNWEQMFALKPKYSNEAWGYKAYIVYIIWFLLFPIFEQDL